MTTNKHFIVEKSTKIQLIHREHCQQYTELLWLFIKSVFGETIHLKPNDLSSGTSSFYIKIGYSLQFSTFIIRCYLTSVQSVNPVCSLSELTNRCLWFLKYWEASAYQLYLRLLCRWMHLGAINLLLTSQARLKHSQHVEVVLLLLPWQK